MEHLIETLATFLAPAGRGVISLTGGGGKTSCLKALGQYYRRKGRSVLLTTTTKIQSPKTYDFDVDHVFLSEDEALMHSPEKAESVFYAERHIMDPKKMVSPRLEVLSLLIPRYDVVIIEADGSKQLPLKYHSERDPVILKETTATLAIMGASAFGDVIDNTCFGFDSQKLVDTAFLNFLISDVQGALKGLRGRGLLLVNQADVKTVPIEELECPLPIILGSVARDEIYGTKGL